MATTQRNRGLYVVLDAGRTFFDQNYEQLRQTLAKRKVYRATRSELSSLADCDLNDLGISRSGINRLALEAAFE